MTSERTATIERVARSEEVQAPRLIRREAQGRPVLLPTSLADGPPIAFGHICTHRHHTHDPHTGGNLARRVVPARGTAERRGIPGFETREGEDDGWVWVGPRTRVPSDDPTEVGDRAGG
jgi:hypothetical protein